MTLTYDELVKNYWDGLFNKLRNFTGGPNFLETWVHDEDHTRSIQGLFEAAASAGQKNLALHVGAETSKELNMSELEKELGLLGKVQIDRPNQETRITVQFNS